MPIFIRATLYTQTCSPSVSPSNTSPCPSRRNGLVEIKCRGREKKSRLLLPVCMSVCAHVLWKLTLRKKMDSVRKGKMKPKPHQPSKMCTPFRDTGWTLSHYKAQCHIPAAFSGASVLIRAVYSHPLCSEQQDKRDLLAWQWFLRLFLWEGPPPSGTWQQGELSSLMLHPFSCPV